MIKIEKNKLKLNRQIYSVNYNINYRKNRIKNKKKEDLDNIIIPEPKKRIKRRIFGDLNSQYSSSVSSESESGSEADIHNHSNKFEDLEIIKEISNLSLFSNKDSHNIKQKKEKVYIDRNYNLKENKNNILKEISNIKIDDDKNYEEKVFRGKENKINLFEKINRREKNVEKEKSIDENEINDSFLPCRIEEQIKIYNYIKNGLKTNGNYNSLYIGGMPGTGKTESIKKVIEIIEKENKYKGTKFRVLFINCVNYQKTSKILKLIYNFIFSSKKSTIKKKINFSNILNDFFSERKSYNGNINLNDPSNSHILLIIDEIDYLINKSQFLLYHIFNWTIYPYSKLIIISISNILNLSNKLFPKIKSRFGQNRIMFKPYTKEQIRQILNYKGIDLEKFDEDSLKLSSMKVAAVNGDLRRVIIILNKARELFENEIKYNINEGNQLINKFYIIRACNELFDCKIINAIKHFNICEKIILSSILLKISKNNNNSIKIEDIFNNLPILIYKYNDFNYYKSNYDLDINWDEFQKIIYNLLKIKIIEIRDKEFLNFKDNFIQIKFYVDEFMIACEKDEEFSPIFKFLTDVLN